MTTPRPKPVHKADAVDIEGRVSALCFMSRRPIDLKRATWTLRDEAVTCPKCRAWLARAARVAARKEAGHGAD